MPSDHVAPGTSEADPRAEGPGRYAYGPARREPQASEVALPRLTFPDLPRLELDELLGQLVERAQEVIATQGRLRGLLRANQLIVADLALPTVLRRIVEAARDLVGARYAALGVISPAGGLSQFVHTGMSDDIVGRIAHLPQGKGLLGALIDDPRPRRLRRIADDQRSSGFPAGHPPMDSFLGFRSGSATRSSATSTSPRAHVASSARRTRSSPPRWLRPRRWRSTTPACTPPPAPVASGCRPPRRSPVSSCPPPRATAPPAPCA